MTNNVFRFLLKVLTVAILTSVVTGTGITTALLTPKLAKKLTTEYVPAIQKLPNLPQYGDFKLMVTRKYAPIVIYGDEHGAFCSGAVIDANYVLTAAHCVVRDNFIISTPLWLSDNKKASGKHIVRVAAANLNEDYALLIGDFSEFSFLPVEFYNSGLLIHSRASVIACGFPYGQIPEVCTPVTGLSVYDFMYVGQGALIRGMSGGPVMLMTGDKRLVIVGVNSAVSGSLLHDYEANVIVAPVTGLLGAFKLQGGEQ